jgi:alanine dehydrogenase
MKIAILKETHEESRVSLVPKDVKRLTDAKHEVYIEKEAGLTAGFKDDEYTSVGAKIASPKVCINTADLILKVSRPSTKLIKRLSNNQLLIAFLFLANNPETLKSLVDHKVNAIGLESIHDNGEYRCLVPCEEIKGSFGVVMGVYHLSRLNENAIGKIFSTIHGNSDRAHFLILNGSYAAYEAAKSILALGGEVTILENDDSLITQLKNDHTLNELAHLCKGKCNVLKGEFELLNQLIPTVDVLINTNASPDSKASRRITLKMINSLRKGSVYIDLAVENGLGSETEKEPNTIKKPTTTINNITQCAIENIPALFAHSASIACSKIITDYLLQLPHDGSVFHNIKGVEPLLNAIQTFNGYITNKATSDSLHLTYTPIKNLLK